MKANSGKNENDNAEHFRELSVLGKRTGAAIDLCKSRSEVTGRRRRRKWQRGNNDNVNENDNDNENTRLSFALQRTLNSPLELARFLKCQASPFGMPSALCEEPSTQYAPLGPGYEIELSNDLDLKFNRAGALIAMDY